MPELDPAIRAAAHEVTRLPFAKAIVTSPADLIDMALDKAWPLIRAEAVALESQAQEHAHGEYVDGLLESAPESWDGEEAADDIAVRYVRHLESEVRRLGGCPERFHYEGCDHAPADLDRETWGRLVRDLRLAWASEQDDPEPSWLLPWDELDDGQREADGRIGTFIAGLAREHERAAIIALAEKRGAVYPAVRENLATEAELVVAESFADLLRRQP
jgi:hypothetical protein